MNHSFRVATLTRDTGKEETAMYCAKCGRTYRYAGYEWEEILFKSDEKPRFCDDPMSGELVMPGFTPTITMMMQEEQDDES